MLDSQFYLDLLKDRMLRDALWPNEKLFLISLLNYFEKFGNLTEKQDEAARKMAVRVVCDRDKFFL